MSDTDLFGAPVLPATLPAVVDPGQKKREARKRYMTPRGYAAKPGTGPKGETCGSCDHMARLTYAKTYRKCDLCRANWTHGPKTDVLARSPACQFWTAISIAENQTTTTTRT